MSRGWLAASVVLVGCGRVGFDPSGGDAVPSSGSFAGLCTFATATVIENGLAIDDAAGATLSTALVSGCGTSPQVRTVAQDDPGILDGATGRPLLPAGDLAIIGGGDGPNRAIAYLLQADTPVAWAGSAFATFTERKTGRTIVAGPTSDGHDYALVMVVTEPIGGDRVLSASGMVGNGTTAAASWFATQIAPTIATNADGWTLVEWTNTDSVPGPSADDTYAVIESGR